MTDVPRRSYPLVVPPPGGFEDAVRRGRRIRRRKAAGGTTGAALALVGALVYSSLTSGPATTGLEQTHNPPLVERTGEPGPVWTPSPEETATPAGPRPSGASGGPASPAAPGPGSGRGDEPAQADPPEPTPARPTRTPPSPGEPYEKRGDITEHDQQLSGYTECLPGDGRAWCAYATVRKTLTSAGTRYELVYALCRAVDANPGFVTFDRTMEADYAATDQRGTSDPGDDDTVWTYSKGQPVVPATDQTRIDPGYCVEWTTVWDGNDDFGYFPPKGTYTLTARSTGRSDSPLPTDTATFEHE